MKKKILITVSILFVLCILGIISIKTSYGTKDISNELSELNLDNTNKLMIVAHPDDEILWGGAHLLQDQYLVVCVTHGDGGDRNREFQSVMETAGPQYIMLDYPDALFDNEWDMFKSSIKLDLREIIAEKDWEEIVTHNSEGEYGHIHHQMLGGIVTNICEDTNNLDQLYYFGKYYTPEEIELKKELLNPISDELLAKKERLLELYTSQRYVSEQLGHMNRYEEWIKAKDLIKKTID